MERLEGLISMLKLDLATYCLKVMQFSMKLIIFILLQVQQEKNRHRDETRRNKTKMILKTKHIEICTSGQNLSDIASQYATQNPAFAIHCCICAAKDV